MMQGRSWHIPYISKTQTKPPDQFVHVLFLQRVADEEYNQIVENLRATDEDWINSLDVPRPPSRKLEMKKWVRDWWPSTGVILKIAEHAYSSESYSKISYRSFILVDSGWEAGNVIAAHWESDGNDSRLSAVRVPMNIAETLLSACDVNEGCTLGQVLGSEGYEDAKVDFYADTTGVTEPEAADPIENYELPQSLPQDLALSKRELIIVSLRTLKQSEIEDLVRDIVNGYKGEEEAPSIKILNWHETSPSRIDIRHIFYRIQHNSSKNDRDMPLVFVDTLLEGDDGRPHLMWALTGRQQSFQMFPIIIENLIKLWKDATQGIIEENLGESEEFVDIWSGEYIYDLEVHRNFDDMSGAPVFYLQPFTPEQERILRAKLRELSSTEEEANWGADWIHFGYLWSDEGQMHSLEDLRDFFERCDPFSPSFDSSFSRHHQLDNYPRNFIAVDERIFESEPQVWLVSHLDFYLNDDSVSDQLGWIYGLLPAKEAHIAWVNVDIANMGLEDFVDEPRKLWLSDLKECKRQWDEQQQGED